MKSGGGAREGPALAPLASSPPTRQLNACFLTRCARRCTTRRSGSAPSTTRSSTSTTRWRSTGLMDWRCRPPRRSGPRPPPGVCVCEREEEEEEERFTVRSEATGPIGLDYVCEREKCGAMRKRGVPYHMHTHALLILPHLVSPLTPFLFFSPLPSLPSSYVNIHHTVSSAPSSPRTPARRPVTLPTTIAVSSPPSNRKERVRNKE